jgi:hypothetical protein
MGQTQTPITMIMLRATYAPSLSAIPTAHSANA